MRFIIFLILCFTAIFQLPQQGSCESECLPKYRFDGKKIVLSESEWEKKLTPEQFYILREHGTEAPFHNLYDAHKAEGIYVCAGCDLPLFSSDAKYDSGTGWPSFKHPICPQNITLTEEGFWLFKKMDVTCSRCGGHIGHIFEDGPPPDGKRYCMNSAALKFILK